MATNAQRWTAHCDMLVNGVATAAQKLRIARAYAWQGRRLAEFDAATAPEQLAFVVKAVRDAEMSRVRQFEAALAAETAVADVETGFPETPAP